MTILNPPKAPRLLASPAEYDPRSSDLGNDILRLYFAQLDNSLGAVLGINGGRYIDCPNGLFFDLGTYSPAAANTGYPLEFKAPYLSNAVSIVDDTKITVAVGGVYNFQYSSAVTSTNSSLKTIWVWIVRNGTPVGYSTNEYTISGSGTDTIISWQFNIDLDVGEYIQMYWAASDTNVTISTTAATPPHPGIPANVVSVNFIAPLPNPRPTPP